ncbi:MAG: signal peptidase II [Nanobdellota archaeon]
MKSRKNANGLGNSDKRIPFLYLLIAAIVLIIDFFTKYIIKMQDVRTEGIVAITPITNKGSLFSLFSNYTSINIIFIILSIIAVVLITLILRNDNELNSKKLVVIGLGSILGGVLGNLYDRIFYGAVFDWINLHFWPVFNIADTGIVVGVILAILTLLPKPKKRSFLGKTFKRQKRKAVKP